MYYVKITCMIQVDYYSGGPPLAFSLPTGCLWIDRFMSGSAEANDKDTNIEKNKYK